MKYTGEKCVSCGEVFAETDDVVVCPECGSPHHRECYKKNNACANADKHGDGYRWKSEAIHIPEVLVLDMPVTDIAEKHNGETLDKGEEVHINIEDISTDESAKRAGIDMSEDMGGVTLREMLSFVRVNTLYYIPVFKRMKELGSKASFNLSCFLFPSFYFANRKMWLWAVIASLLGVLLNIPAYVLVMAEQGIFSENVVSYIYQNQNFIHELENICSVGWWGVRLVMCIFANWIYYKFSIKRVQFIRKNGGKYTENMMLAYGGVKPVNIIMITLITMAISLTVMVGITILLGAISV